MRGKIPLRGKTYDPSKPIRLKIDTLKLKQLSKLKYLELTFFDFRKFPVELCYAKDMIGLSIAFCLIDTLPMEIENLKGLQVLEIRLNNLNHLPGSFKNLTNLERVDLANNSFQEIPIVLTEMSNLKSINLGNSESEVEITDKRSLPFIVHTNKIDYLAQFEPLKKILLRPNLKKILLQVDSKSVIPEIKVHLNSDDLSNKILWSVYENN